MQPPGGASFCPNPHEDLKATLQKKISSLGIFSGVLCSKAAPVTALPPLQPLTPAMVQVNCMCRGSPASHEPDTLLAEGTQSIFYLMDYFPHAKGQGRKG